ncbi:cell division protein FtsA [Paraliobacillus sp. X-1268]|uniref:cell division protein FtsA n=1 Tax=Paraliobacillus sp. X-1268 TaxID=2213193 RepID=UPI000E3BBE55|nr:cell division protein FtsA [Paraliobacillus sp. X-1268]
MNEYIFALDIGTRSVVGLILEQTDEHYKLIDYVMQEHEERSMLDGQIHDVVAVAKVIHQVKEKLELKHTIKLTKVCVAAAGRALKTKRTTITKNIEQHPLIEKEDILFLELSAVQQAQHDLALEEADNLSTHYYCVGYSVIQYKLDNDIIGSLIDQQGSKAEVEIIATFLPKVVVESLLSALQRADLEMEALTLEPIAAINVLIPTSMRRLNVALVDIGAGTSDIALTDSGTIAAYGMVPRAGDEITEAISDHYLLDFKEAERVKKEITGNNESIITDILGFEEKILFDELAQAIDGAIEKLADAIAQEILELNTKAPKAVMLVGGGSLTPNLTIKLAEKLQLPVNRVAIRGTDAIPNLKFSAEVPAGPAFITPIGIAIAAKQNPVHYISVTVNDRAVRLFDMKQLTVGDCLLAAGIHIDKLYGRPGMAYIISFNGQSITLPGTYGKAPSILLNGQPITIEEPIKHGDILHVEKGENGKNPIVTIEELVGEVNTFTVYLNERKQYVKPSIEVNGVKSNLDYVLKDHDKVNVIESKTVEDFLIKHNRQDILTELYTFKIYIDGEVKELSDFSTKLLVNGKVAKNKTVLQPGNKIEVVNRQVPTIGNVLHALSIELDQSMSITYNGEPILLNKQTIRVFQQNKERDIDDLLYHGDKLELRSTEETGFIFQDIFRHISIDLSKVKGSVDIKKNGKPTTFFEPLEPNDEITIN